MRSSPPRADELARINATIRPREPRCELLDTATHEIWMAREPVPRAWFDALVLEPPLVRARGRTCRARAATLRAGSRVEKHHVIAFDAGRTVALLRSPEGVETVEGVRGRGAPPLPAGWSVRAATLEAAWEIALPAPTETGWLANGASFQGPVRAPMV